MGNNIAKIRPSKDDILTIEPIKLRKYRIQRKNYPSSTKADIHYKQKYISHTNHSPSMGNNK